MSQAPSTTTDFRFYASPHDEYIDVAWYEGAEWTETMNWFFAR